MGDSTSTSCFSNNLHYNAHKELREKVARGNSVLQIHDVEKNKTEYDCIIFALRKFTGGKKISCFFGMKKLVKLKKRSDCIWILTASYRLQTITN